MFFYYDNLARRENYIVEYSERTQQIQDNGKSVTVKIIEARQSSCVIVFAAGRGGNPTRHLSLLRFVASQGYTVVAPYFDMLPSLTATKEELESRIEQLEIVLNYYLPTGQPIIGIGHSIGATLLLTLAGGTAITSSGDPIGSKSTWKFNQLVLMAPPVDFFLHPGALNMVDTQIYLRNGGKDTITPLSKALLLKEILEEQGQVKFMVDVEAGHFSYMNELPPQIEDSQPDREAFLLLLAKDIAQFVTI